MYRKLICFVAFVLILAVSVKVMASLHRSFSERKAVIEISENDESKEAKAEKDYKDKAELAYYAAPESWAAITVINPHFFNTNTRLLLSRHFLAVPTPPPWA